MIQHPQLHSLPHCIEVFTRDLLIGQSITGHNVTRTCLEQGCVRSFHERQKQTESEMKGLILMRLIFHISIPCDKTFLWVPLFFDTVTLTLEFDPFFCENFNLANYFWTMSARALILPMSIPCDKTFLLVLNLLSLTFDLFFLKLTLFITSK